MSLDEQDPPVHRVSRVEDRERLLAETLAHTESRQELYRISYPEAPPRGRWKPPLAMAIFVLAALVAALRPEATSWGMAAAPTGAQLERGLRVALYLQAQQVEAFRVREGRLPDSLEELPVRLPDLLYVRSNSRVYQLVGARSDGTPLVYDSARPREGLDQVVEGWIGGSPP